MIVWEVVVCDSDASEAGKYRPQPANQPNHLEQHQWVDERNTIFVPCPTQWRHEIPGNPT
jgi:hypothetical protein